MKFQKWFEKQHGKRPSLTGKTDNDLCSMIVDGHRAKAMLDLVRLWDARWQSALYAWNATDAYKKGKKL